MSIPVTGARVRHAGALPRWVVRFVTWVAALVVTGCTAPTGGAPERAGQTTQALIATEGGVTIGASPTFNTADGTIGTCSVASGIHAYATEIIVPPTGGTYTMQSVASNSITTTDLTSGDFGQYDTFMFVVQGAFNPSSPNANIIGCDDDVGPDCATAPLECLSGVTASLTGGTTYTIVVTTYGTGVAGTVALETDGTSSVASPASIAATGGTPQSAAVSTAFATALSVTVTDASSNPVSGVTVNFSAPGAGASAALSAPSAMTNGSGVASVTATANGTTGGYSVTASVTGVSGSASFSLTNTAAPSGPTQIIATSGGGQSAGAGTSFASDLLVTVSDASSVPYAGVTVTFSAPSSGATCMLGSSSGVTNVAGQVSMPVTAGGVLGTYSVTASVVGISTPATFSLTNTPGTPSSIAVSSGDGQSTTIGTAFASSISALVEDAYGNAVPMASVTFTAPSSGASATLGSPSTTTNSMGVATSSVTANGTAGMYVVSASVVGAASPADFTLTNSACSFTLASSSASVGADAESNSVSLTASDPSCAWTASPNDAWITGVTPSGTGSGTVSFSTAANTDAARSGTITIGGQTFTVNQAGGCSATLASPSTTATAAGGSSSVGITLSGPSCAWTASSNDAWITGVTPGGTGSGTVAFTVAANAGASRVGTITAGGQTFSIMQSGGCTFMLGAPGTPVPAAGLSSSVTWTASDPSCAWTASTGDAWITGVTPSGTGSGSVAFTVAANTGPARTGSIVAGGQTFSIMQSTGCTFLLGSTGAIAPAAGLTSSVTLTASDPACPWTATSSDSWITGVTSSGSGTGSVSYSAAANLGLARLGSFVAGGRTFSVTQLSGCSATLDTTDVTVPASGGNASVHVTLSNPLCGWTASSNTSWLTVPVTSGTGTTDVTLTGAATTGPARTTQVQLAGQTVNVHQSSGCVVTLPATTGSASAGGGPSTLAATTGTGCVLAASSNVPWITNVTISGNVVSYSVTASKAPTRLGMITVASTDSGSSAAFTVTQSSACAPVLPSGTASLGASASSDTFSVTTNLGCGFTAATSTSWIHDVTATATGVTYDVDADPGPSRVGTIGVTDRDSLQTIEYTVLQGAGCALTLSSASLSVANGGGAGSFSVTSGPGCTWTADTSTPWISAVTVTLSGVTFSSAVNPGASRSGTITVHEVETQASVDVTIGEASGCGIGLPAASSEVDLAGGPATFSVVSGPGCTWTAATNDTWVHDVAPTATGVEFVTDANSGIARTATVTVTASETGASAAYIVQQAGAIVAPSILTNPLGVSITEGDPFVLTVTATGGDLEYQWRKDGVAIANATALSLRVLAATVSDAGTYDVVVSNAAGTVTSTGVVVAIAPSGAMGLDAGVGPMGQGEGGIDASSVDASVVEAGVPAPVEGGGSDATTVRDAQADAIDVGEPLPGPTSSSCSCSMPGRDVPSDVPGGATGVLMIGVAAVWRRRRNRTAG